MPSTRMMVLAAAGAALSVSPAAAQFLGPPHHPRHRHHYRPAQPDGSGEPFGYRDASYPQAYGGYYGYGRGYPNGYGYGYGYAGGWEAAANARATAQAYNEPGVTLELAPDAKQTATGGPVGGLPGRR